VAPSRRITDRVSELPARGPADIDKREVARRLLVQRNLVPIAFEHLTRDALRTLPLRARGPTKALLRAFFSSEEWSDTQARALAEAVGPGEGWWSRPLDDEVSLEYGWRDCGFTIVVSSASRPEPAESDDPPSATLDAPVVAEATTDPRTIRFRSGPIHNGEAQWFESPASGQAYWRAARLFDQFPEVANMRVESGSVAVTLRRASDWERLRAHVLAAVSAVFEGAPPVVEPRWLSDDPVLSRDRRRSAGGDSRATRLARMWAEMRSLRPSDARDLEALITASHSDEPMRRQVAASLFLEADPAVADKHWERLLVDSSLAVRRATVDALANAGRDELRPLLERALGDRDGWVRRTALRGLVELGPEPSRDAIMALAHDPDVGVRLEVANLAETTP
jgi:hypothetical protein